MGKLSKLFCSILLILLVFVLFSVTITYQSVGNLRYTLTSYENYDFIGKYIPQILFWLSLFFIALIIILLLFVIFAPKKTSSFKINKSKGSLVIEKKAIENFVLGIVKKDSDIEDPSVRAKMYRKKIKVQISGNLAPGTNVIDKKENLMEEISDKISSLLGVDSKIKSVIKFNDFEVPKSDDTKNSSNNSRDTKSSSNKPRVI
ncbi:hypothetical protein BG262_08370 [Floricoccus penangensis]|uniref:Alkaline shock response membrane anchor protein AmaP n=1 Tax=Floricoccus penangensis TaxID=1859475 RepID=A0A9Q5JHJ1_9LACT|nr:alkaline shock response membrane anchor protein AmaP [Floricoccus penangensis]OFI47705.1 hypothetical protein BG262_08370 [Floricoccus penangensis]